MLQVKQFYIFLGDKCWGGGVSVKVKDDDMSWGHMRNPLKVSSKNLEGTDHMEDLDADGSLVSMVHRTKK